MESIANQQAPEVTGSQDNEFWKWGLRTIIYIDLVISGIQAIRVFIAGGGAAWVLIDAQKRGQFLLDLGPMAILAFALPITFFISSIGCWMLKPAARILMIVYCCAEIGYQIGAGVQVSSNQPPSSIFMYWFLATERLGYLFGILAINLIYMTRPQIKAIFDASRPAVLE